MKFEPSIHKYCYTTIINTEGNELTLKGNIIFGQTKNINMSNFQIFQLQIKPESSIKVVSLHGIKIYQIWNNAVI